MIGAGDVARTVDTTAPLVTLTDTDLAGGAVLLAISQRGIFGESLAAHLTIPA